MPSLLYIGENPGSGTGSPIIVLRHLKRFAADGWTISVIGDYGGDYRTCREAGWAVTQLCHRRWWWPPYRQQSASLRWLRLRLLAYEAAAANPAPDAIFSYFAAHSDFSAQLATHVAQVTGAPLHMLAHDDAASFPYARGREKELRRFHEGILAAADACWFVSPELADCYPATAAQRRLLYPIPEGWHPPAAWTEERVKYPRVYYAGYVWPQQLPLLGREARCARDAGAELVVMSRQSDALRAFCEAEPARWHAPFPTNREALAHLVDDAAGLIVSYADTIADMPWCETSFPSKFVEYCHLGLPIAIVAPPDSAIARWAQRTRYPYLFEPTNLAGLQDWFAGLRRREVWQVRAALSLHLARTEFNPDHIHASLANAMIPGTQRRAA